MSMSHERRAEWIMNYVSERREKAMQRHLSLCSKWAKSGVVPTDVMMAEIALFIQSMGTLMVLTADKDHEFTAVQAFRQTVETALNITTEHLILSTVNDPKFQELREAMLKVIEDTIRTQQEQEQEQEQEGGPTHVK